MEKGKGIFIFSILGVLCAGIIFYFSLFFYRNYRQELVAVEQNQLLVMARTVGQSLVNYLNQELEVMDLYFSEPGLGNSADDQDIRKAAAAFMDKKDGLYDGMACYDSRGSRIFEAGILDFDYREAPDSQEAVICGKKLSPKGWYQMFISRKFEWNKEPCTVVCAMNLNRIYQQIVAPVQIGKGGYSIVKDRDLVILMHHASSQIGIDAAYDRNVRYPQLDLQDLFEWVTMQQNQKEGCSIIHSYVWDDPELPPERRIVAYTTIHVSGEDWIVNSTLPYEELNEPLSRMIRRLLGMSALFLFFLVVFVYFMTRLLMREEAQKREIAYLKEINQGMELLRRKEEEIQRYERMQSIGQMSSHIAHEFNNYLTPVMIYGELLEGDNDISPQNQELIHGIVRSVEEAAALSRRLLDFSRQDSYGERICQDLRREAAEACQVVDRMAPENVSLVTDISGDPLWTQGNKGMMSHLLLNLSNNAFHAMEGRDGVLTVRLFRMEKKDVREDSRKVFLDGISEKVQKDLAEQIPNDGWGDLSQDFTEDFQGEWAVLTVTDTGCGISREALDKIFEPFYTTKRSGKGTGLGLSVVRNVMEAVKGRIRITSRAGVGTSFILSFPLTEQSDPEDRGQERQGFRRLVVVDDDPKVLKALDAMLRGVSVKAECCSHPAAALALLQKRRNDYDMVLTDYQMPSVNGLELAAMVRRLNPQIRLVLMSGLDDSQFDWYLKNGMIDDFIPKTELYGRLREMVGRNEL